MLRKINCWLSKAADFLAGLKMTIVAGVFLAFSLALLITKNFVELNISPWLDPALITVVISGYPLLYLALYRLIKQRWVSSALLITVAMIASLCLAEVFAAGEVAFIMAIGAILEDKTAERAKKGLNNLIKLKPRTGRIIFEGRRKGNSRRRNKVWNEAPGAGRRNNTGRWQDNKRNNFRRSIDNDGRKPAS